MMLNEKEYTESMGNVDNQNSYTNTESSDVASESPRNPSLEEKLASKMLSYSRETIFLFIVIIFSFAFAAIYSAPPKISKLPSAIPFFNKNSVILDFYKGQVSAMIERASDRDLSFVMYYAPWDAESQVVRHEFEIVAQRYHSLVFFSAINCWHPGSECRAQYPRIQSYPVLILYPLRGSGIAYKGIMRAPYIMKFLQNYLQALNYISERQDLNQLLIKNEIVIVGFFNFTGISISPGFQDFYQASIHALEKDPNQEIKFAVMTDPKRASEDFGIEHFPTASLYLWNESLIYPLDKTWSTGNILNWMENCIHRVSVWLQPPRIKSLTLAPYLHTGPVLLLFTPRNPLHSTNYNYKLLREIALEYHNCDNLWWTRTLIQSLRKERIHSQFEYSRTMTACQEQLSQSNYNCFQSSILTQDWVNNSSCSQISMNRCLLHTERNRRNDDKCNIAPNHLNGSCNLEDFFKLIHKHGDVVDHYCCNESPQKEIKSFSKLKIPKQKYFSSLITGEYDPNSAMNLRLKMMIENCKNLFIANEYHYPVFCAHTDEDHEMKLIVSACNSNRTLTFIAIDSLNYFHFTEGLGVDLLKIKNKTAVVILDAQQESQYIMTDNLNRNSLINFINNFLKNSLKRTLRADTTRRFARDFQTVSECRTRKLNEICIPELTTETFLNTVLNPDRDIVVFYYSPYCAFCSAVAYVYLSIAQYFLGMNILFTRIDGDNNDLPWEYSMNRYPSILFSPAKRKEDSTVYPVTLSITIPNLLNFILANLDDDSHIEAVVNICHMGAGEPPKECVARIRKLCLDSIQNQLRAYRKLRRQRNYLPKLTASNKRREILQRLEHIRDIHLILSSVENLAIDEKFYTIMKKFRYYYKNLKKIGNNMCEILKESERESNGFILHSKTE